MKIIPQDDRHFYSSALLIFLLCFPSHGKSLAKVHRYFFLEFCVFFFFLVVPHPEGFDSRILYGWHFGSLCEILRGLLLLDTVNDTARFRAERLGLFKRAQGSCLKAVCTNGFFFSFSLFLPIVSYPYFNRLGCRYAIVPFKVAYGLNNRRRLSKTRFYRKNALFTLPFTKRPVIFLTHNIRKNILILDYRRENL